MIIKGVRATSATAGGISIRSRTSQPYNGVSATRNPTVTAPTPIATENRARRRNAALLRVNAVEADSSMITGASITNAIPNITSYAASVSSARGARASAVLTINGSNVISVLLSARGMKKTSRWR